MSQIGVYDIASDTWYNVTASGDIPYWRSAACTSVSAAPDDSSFQITMYGGKDLFSNGTGFEDMYVLTLPSFQWINVTGNNNSDYALNQGYGIGRSYSYCTSWKEREMIVLGGELRSGTQVLNLGTCNSSYSTMRVLDLSTFEWKDQHDPDPGNYTVPDVVVRRIGGTSAGGATSASPSGGFEQGSLNEIFATTVPSYTPNANNGVSGGGSNGSSSNSSSNGGTSGGNPNHGGGSNTGAIAGGVVGGIVGLALVGLVVFFCMRSRTRRRRTATPVRQEIPAHEGGEKVELPSESKLQQYGEMPTEPSHHEMDPNSVKHEHQGPVELP